MKTKNKLNISALLIGAVILTVASLLLTSCATDKGMCKYVRKNYVGYGAK